MRPNARISSQEIRDYPWYMRALFFFQKRTFGKILAAAKVWGRKAQVYLAFLMLYNRLNAKNALLEPERTLVFLHHRVTEAQRDGKRLVLFSSYEREGGAGLHHPICGPNRTKVLRFYWKAKEAASNLLVSSPLLSLSNKI